MFTRTNNTTNACNRFYLYYMGIRMWYDGIFMENAWYILFYKNAIIHGSEIPSRSNYIFSPHIQCVCFVAFSDQAKKKTKTKNKKTAAYELICSYKKALYFWAELITNFNRLFSMKGVVLFVWALQIAGFSMLTNTLIEG